MKMMQLKRRLTYFTWNLYRYRGRPADYIVGDHGKRVEFSDIHYYPAPTICSCFNNVYVQLFPSYYSQ